MRVVEVGGGKGVWVKVGIRGKRGKGWRYEDEGRVG
jgi:hypothetical protein